MFRQNSSLTLHLANISVWFFLPWRASVQVWFLVLHDWFPWTKLRTRRHHNILCGPDYEQMNSVLMQAQYVGCSLMRLRALSIRLLVRRISTFSVTKSTPITEANPFMSALIIFCCLRFCSRSSFSCSSLVICAFAFSTRYRTRRRGFSSPMRTNIALLQPCIFPWKISEATFVLSKCAAQLRRSYSCEKFRSVHRKVCYKFFAIVHNGSRK